ncbi:MAG: response regulator [Oscillospiraceae bacterium]|nr:response regulator [Oscillospiraceae bacterium]
MFNMKAAVCDDERVFHKEISFLMRKYMKAKNIEIFIDFYENGEKLLRSEKEYDIIFLDYQMEGINGIETAEKLRKALPTVLSFL